MGHCGYLPLNSFHPANSSEIIGGNIHWHFCAM